MSGFRKGVKYPNRNMICPFRSVWDEKSKWYTDLDAWSKVKVEEPWKVSNTIYSYSPQHSATRIERKSKWKEGLITPLTLIDQPRFTKIGLSPAFSKVSEGLLPRLPSYFSSVHMAQYNWTGRGQDGIGCFCRLAYYDKESWKNQKVSH